MWSVPRKNAQEKCCIAFHWADEFMDYRWKRTGKTQVTPSIKTRNDAEVPDAVVGRPDGSKPAPIPSIWKQPKEEDLLKEYCKP